MKLHVRAPLVLLIGGLIAAVSSLSIHAFMIQGLHIPDPPQVGAWSFSKVPDLVLRVAGIVAVFMLSPPRLKASPVQAAGWLTLILLTVNEQLIRDPLMEVVNLSSLTLYPFLDVVPQYLTAATVAICVVASRRFLSSWKGRVIVSILAALFSYMVVGPIANQL